jgi:hypothetical protein
MTSAPQFATIQSGPRTITVIDQEDIPSGASHIYEITDTKTGLLLGRVELQNGPEKEAGINGVQHVDLLRIVQHRLDCFQRGSFASPINEVTCGAVSAAIASEDTRTRRRELGRVEGTSGRAAGVDLR